MQDSRTPVNWLCAFAAVVTLLLGCQSTSTQLPADRTQKNAPVGSTPASSSAAALAMPVAAAENRAVSFTNKRSAFYYTQTHVNDHPEHAYFRGLNIAGRRIFSDCTLYSDGQALDPRAAAVVVRP